MSLSCTDVTSTDADLSPEDLELLKRWVNPAYLSPQAWSKIQSKFEADGSVQLQNFLLKEVAKEVLGACNTADAAAGRTAGQIPAYEMGTGEGELPWVAGGWGKEGEGRGEKIGRVGGRWEGERVGR